MLKDLLLLTIDELDKRSKRAQSVMGDCVDHKLDRSLEQYQGHLQRTCELLLSKNPVTMMKTITKDFQEEEEEEQDDE